MLCSYNFNMYVLLSVCQVEIYFMSFNISSHVIHIELRQRNVQQRSPPSSQIRPGMTPHLPIRAQQQGSVRPGVTPYGPRPGAQGIQPRTLMVTPQVNGHGEWKYINWTTSRKNVVWVDLWKPSSSCASTQSNQGFWCQLTESFNPCCAE